MSYSPYLVDASSLVGYFVSLEMPASRCGSTISIVNTEEVMVAMRGRVLCADEETVVFLIQVSRGAVG